MSTPEALLNTLRKLEANKACANCDTVAKFGHSNICEKFKTFVCNHCKSAHQSYSHRVKSVTMSNWSKEEVDALKEENGGGNAVARRTWLGNWQEGRGMRKPSENDHLDLFKKFINAVYNDKTYYIEPSASTRSAPAKQPPATTSAPAAASTPAPSQDLLGFSPPSSTPAFEANFDAFSTPVPPAAPSTSFAQFDAFSAPVAPAAPPASQPKHDEWSAFQSASTTTSASSNSFDPFALSSGPTSAPASNSFDPFAPSNPAPARTNNGFGVNNIQTGGNNAFNNFPNPSGMNQFGGGFPPQQQFNNAPQYTAPQQYGAPMNGYNFPPQQQQQQYPSYGGGMAMGGGGASISSLLDPNMVSNPHIQQLSGNILVGNQQRTNGRPTNTNSSNSGRDPFAGLAFN